MALPGVYRTFTATIASGTTTSSEVDLGCNYDHVLLFIPSATTSAASLFISDRLGGTYYPAANNAGTVESWASGISGRYVQVANHNRFLKIIHPTAPTADTTFTIVCYS